MRPLAGAAIAACVVLCANASLAQQGISTRYEGNILVQTDVSVCSRSPELGQFFADHVARLPGQEPGINDLAVACALHENAATYYWVTRGTTEAALRDAVSECDSFAASQTRERGQIVEPCAVYGVATRGGSDTALLQRWAMTRTALAISSRSTTTTFATSSSFAWSVMSAGAALNATLDYAPFRLLAYSIHDGARDAAGQSVDFFVSETDETVSIVQDPTQATTLRFLAVDAETVVIFRDGDNTSGPRFLVADENGVRFSDTLTQYSYFSVRQPLETTAAEFGFVSLESKQVPGHFLRHRGFRVWLDAVSASSSSLDRRDSTFLFLGIESQAPDTSVSVQVSAATVSQSVQMTATQRVSSYMQSHWASSQRVDFAYCGIEQGGNGGFGTRRVPTNSHGDVHIFTPDGLTYDFQAGGEFMLVASQDGSVAVQTRQTIHADDPSVSSNSAVALLVGETVVEFYADSAGQRFYVDGVSGPIPAEGLQLPGGARIESDGSSRGATRFIVHWANEAFSARVNLYQGFLNVGVAGSGGTYAGLIGNLDGNPKNDILPRGGAQLICPPASGADIMRYGDTWRVSVDETLLRAELRETREVLITEIGTDQRINVETAIYHVLEQNFVGMSAETTVGIDIVAAIVGAMYSIDETAAVEAVTNLFQQQGYMEVSQGITVGTITNVVTTYREFRESRTIETLDIERRAIAQRVCEASGIGDHLALATCIMDVALTQNEVFVDSAQDFAVDVADLPAERRFTGSSDYNPLDAQVVILPAARVIELVGPPDVVPQLARRPAVPADLEVAYVSGAPSITLQCLGNAEVPLTGVGIVNNMLSRVTGSGDFPANCRGYEVTAVDGDVQLSAICHTPGGVQSSTISLLEVPAFARMLETPACAPQMTVDATARTAVTDITTQISGNACDAAGAPDPATLLAQEPLAGGVAVFCATHSRGLTYRHEYGRTLEDALARVAVTCAPAAQSMVALRGEVIIPCREVGRAQRDFTFDGGQGGLERDVEVRITEPLIAYSAVPPSLSLVLEPRPALTASCNTGEPVTLEGISAVEGLLSYSEGTESNFQTQCFDVQLIRTDDDVVLQATCFNADGSDAQTSALSLLGVPALLELASGTMCQPAPEPVPASCTAEMLMGPPLPADGVFLPFAQDGLQTDFPNRGDFVLVRSESAGIEVQARRDLWVSDRSESVFTALVMIVGQDVIEVHATPEPEVRINGALQDSLLQGAAEDSIELAGAGTIRGVGPRGFEVAWPGTSFAVRVTIYAGSHLVPEIRPDPALYYQGLARFTSQWLLEGSQSGFSIPLGGDPGCACAQ